MYYSATLFWWEISPRERSLSGVWVLWYSLSMIREASKGEQCLLEPRPSASSVPLPWAGKKGNGTYARWLPLSHIDLGSEKAIYLPSRGKTRVSGLQGSQQRCANAAAIDTIKPRAAICSGGKMQAMPRMGSSPSHRHSKPKGSRGLAGGLAAACLAWALWCSLQGCLLYRANPGQGLLSNIQLLTGESSDTSDQSVPSLLATTSLPMGGATQKGTFNCKCSEEITGIVKSLPWLAQVLKSMHRACPCKVEKAAEAKQSGTGLLARAQFSSKSACREQASCACQNRSKTQNRKRKNSLTSQLPEVDLESPQLHGTIQELKTNKDFWM